MNENVTGDAVRVRMLVDKTFDPDESRAPIELIKGEFFYCDPLVAKALIDEGWAQPEDAPFPPPPKKAAPGPVLFDHNGRPIG